MQTHDKDAIGYSFVPALGHHLVTPAYDFLCSLFGLGRGFKSAVVDQAGIVDGTRVLDLACGTGVTAMIVKQRHPRCAVTGLDVDARILEAARRRMTKAEVSGVDLVCAPAERTGLDAASFDTVISTLAFHHLPPRSKQEAAGEVARLLRAGGTFLLVDIQPRARSGPTMTEEQAVSPKWASRSNTADNLYQVFSRAGLHAHAEEPPRTWAFRPWLFALRATKPATSAPTPARAEASMPRRL
jgi:ubiquinone/menaquinone biosynthesis C-methylase UbiE